MHSVYTLIKSQLHCYLHGEIKGIKKHPLVTLMEPIQEVEEGVECEAFLRKSKAPQSSEASLFGSLKAWVVYWSMVSQIPKASWEV